MIKKILKSLITVFLLIIYASQAYSQKMQKKIENNITENSDITILKELLKKADKNTLVIFDVRTVLVVEQDAILQPAHKKRFKQFKAKIDAKLSKEKSEELYSIILSQKKLELVDKKILEIFALMRAKEVKFIALTSGRTGRFGIIDKREDLRIKLLKDLSIEFTDSYPDIKPTIFDEIAVSKSEPSMYKDGILFASKAKKGTVLKEFYNKEKINANKIIFIDNQIKNLLSVGEFCMQKKINYRGIHYTNVALRKIPLIDEKIVDYQFKVLLEQGKWISDKEAREDLSLSKQ